MSANRKLGAGRFSGALADIFRLPFKKCYNVEVVFTGQNESNLIQFVCMIKHNLGV